MSKVGGGAVITYLNGEDSDMLEALCLRLGVKAGDARFGEPQPMNIWRPAGLCVMGSCSSCGRMLIDACRTDNGQMFSALCGRCYVWPKATEPYVPRRLRAAA